MTQDQLNMIWDDAIASELTREGWGAHANEEVQILWRLDPDGMWLRQTSGGLWKEVPSAATRVGAVHAPVISTDSGT